MQRPPLRATYWRVRYARWGRQPQAEPGYAVLLPVPGDLPVFLDIALAVLARQTGRHRVEILVTPDQETPQFLAALARHRSRWAPDALRLARLARAERVLLPQLNDPARYHPAQLIAGTRASTATHVVFHDADLVPAEDTMHDRLYETAVLDDLDACGVDPAWDPWYAAQGFNLVATWEMCARVGWLRAFPPHRHFGHEATIRGERHEFDTTFWPQCHSEQRKLAVVDGLAYTHFNYVISTYRHFQAQPHGFHDGQFRLLLIRMLADLFDESGADYAVPQLHVLAEGLTPDTDADVPVRYEPADAESFTRFRRQFEQMIQAPWVSDAQRGQAGRALQPFDDWALGVLEPGSVTT